MQLKVLSVPSLIAGLLLVASGNPAIAAKVDFAAQLSASKEVPPNDSKGTGTLAANYDTASKKLSWTVTYSGLTGPATGAHFHGPASPAKNAPVVVPVKGGLKSPIKGTATLSDAQANELMAGELYFNIHTAAHKDGEIRGQVSKAK